jgi:hypothetical protein
MGLFKRDAPACPEAPGCGVRRSPHGWAKAPMTFNLGVVGSIPTGLTQNFLKLLEK